MNEEGFYHWLKSQKFTIGLSMLCACLPLVLQGVGNSSNNTLLNGLKGGYVYNICNILFILVTLYLLTKSNFLINREADKSSRLFEYVKDRLGGNSHIYHYGEKVLFHRMDTSFKQFYYSWLVIWVIWLVMYVGQLMYKLVAQPGSEQAFYNECLFENTLNLMNSCAMFFIYMVITISTVSTYSKKEGRSQMHTAVICLIFVAVALILLDYQITYTKHTNPFDYYKIELAIQLVIGIIASMSFMAVMGRLNSSFLDVPQWLIISLYFYATLQMLYPFTLLEKMIDPQMAIINISDHKDQKAIHTYLVMITKTLYVLAFFGKILLFIMIRWIMLKKRFLFFLLHKANSLAESDNMLIDFNNYYEGSEEKKVEL